MLKRLLGDQVIFGLSSRKLDCGITDPKLPNVVTLECDKFQLDLVQKELTTALPRINSTLSKKDRILHNIFTNCVAVPCFSSVASRKDTSKLALYSSLMAQEKIYHKSLFSCKVLGIQMEHLDQVPPHQYTLSPSMLHSLEQETLNNKISPIRYLLWNKMYQETHQKLTMSVILQKHPNIETKT